MSRNRAYKRIDVKQVDVEALRDRAVQWGNAGAVVGLDVGKDEIVACLRWPHAELNGLGVSAIPMKSMLLWSC